MTVMRKLTLLLLCLALGIGVCDAKKKNRGVYFRTDAEIVLDKPYFGLNVSNMIQVVLEADRNPASVRVETENVPAEAVSVRVRRRSLVVQEKERYVQAGSSVCGRRSAGVVFVVGNVLRFFRDRDR